MSTYTSRLEQTPHSLLPCPFILFPPPRLQYNVSCCEKKGCLHISKTWMSQNPSQTPLRPRNSWHEVRRERERETGGGREEVWSGNGSLSAPLRPLYAHTLVYECSSYIILISLSSYTRLQRHDFASFFSHFPLEVKKRPGRCCLML